MTSTTECNNGLQSCARYGMALALMAGLGTALHAKERAEPTATADAGKTNTPDKQQPRTMNDLWGSRDATAQSASDPRTAWFTQDRYAMFIHWGLFSQAASTWNGKKYYGIAEWLMHPAMAGVSKNDYATLASQFDPQSFDADAWVAFFKRAGVKNIVITAKHHDGFAMFKSKVDTFNIVDGTPYKRDPLKELAQACHKAGIRFGFYYSQYQDWREQGSAAVAWDDPAQKNSFDAYFQHKALPQVRELLRNYGPISVVWFDTPGTMGEKYSRQLVNLVKKYQPQALINSRIGNGVGDYSTYGDNEVPRVSPPGVWEAVDTTNDSWGYSVTDYNWKSPQELLHRLISTTARGGTYMINMGPRADGSFPDIPQAALTEVGDWLKRNGETIYGVQRSPWSIAQPWGDVTTGQNGLYLHVFDWPAGGTHSVALYGLQGKVRGARLLDGGTNLAVAQDGDWTRITLPDRRPDALVPVVALDMDGDYRVKDADIIAAETPSTVIAERAKCNGCTFTPVGWMERFGEWKAANSLTGWTPGSLATWTAQVQQPGIYKLRVEYSVNSTADFSEWEISVGDARYSFEAHYTGEREVKGRTDRRQFWGALDPRYRRQDIGTIILGGGAQAITVRPLTGNGTAASVKITALRLEPMPIAGLENTARQ